jgi:soluble lytic murein transglycosylase-like protein
MLGRKPSFGRRAGLSPGLLLVLATVVSTAVAPHCLAQVIEISASGDTVTYAAPAIFTSTGVESIAATNPALARSLPAADLSRVIAEAALRNQLSADLVTEVAWRESRFHQAAVSKRDAVGVMQLTAATAHDLGVDRYDVRQNIHGGAAYLRRMMDRYGGDLRLTLAAYNAGPGAVDRYHGVPPFQETQAYVTAILGRLALRAPQVPSPDLLIR